MKTANIQTKKKNKEQYSRKVGGRFLQITILSQMERVRILRRQNCAFLYSKPQQNSYSSIPLTSACFCMLYSSIHHTFQHVYLLFPLKKTNRSWLLLTFPTQIRNGLLAWSESNLTLILVLHLDLEVNHKKY